jgi:hypothetical protein
MPALTALGDGRSRRAKRVQCLCGRHPVSKRRGASIQMARRPVHPNNRERPSADSNGQALSGTCRAGPPRNRPWVLFGAWRFIPGSSDGRTQRQVAVLGGGALVSSDWARASFFSFRAAEACPTESPRSGTAGGKLGEQTPWPRRISSQLEGPGSAQAQARPLELGRGSWYGPRRWRHRPRQRSGRPGASVVVWLSSLLASQPRRTLS